MKEKRASNLEAVFQAFVSGFGFGVSLCLLIVGSVAAGMAALLGAFMMSVAAAVNYRVATR